LSAIFSFAVKRKIAKENPCSGIKTFKSGQSQRFLSGEELARLGQALGADGLNDNAVKVIRLLILTACRKSEIEGLLWSEVDFNLSLLRLSDSKTGHKVVPLSATAVELLAKLRQAYEIGLATKSLPASAFVFPAKDKPDVHFIGTPKVWYQVRKSAGLEDVRLHDLRHTFASFAALDGQSLLIIGKILGHTHQATTARYAHLTDDPVRLATNKTSEALAKALAGMA
jgi:integrase